MQKSDTELIEQTLNGSLEAFDQLMERYQRLVFKVAFGFGKNRQNSLDITQNAFLKAYENLSSFKGKGSFKAWIVRITYNESINWVKKSRLHDNSDISEETLMNHYESISQEDELLARENKTQLLQSLFALNTRYRLAVVLRYFNEMPIKEISGILKCSEGVVKNMLHRSLRQLKQSLQEMSDDIQPRKGEEHGSLQ